MRWLLRAIWRTLSIAKKEFVHVGMDPGALFLSIFAPAVVLAMLGLVFNFDVGDSVIAVVDQDQSPRSAEYIRSLTSDPLMKIAGYPDNYAEAERLIQSGRVDAVVIIPPGFGADLAAGRTAQVHTVIDGVSATTARGTMAALDARTRLYVQRSGLAGPGGIEVLTRAWFNENLTTQHSMIPGLMALVLILPAMAVALGMTREKETGTLETLVTTPVLASDVLTGKIIVYMMTGVVSALVALGASSLLFGVPFRGSIFLWILATACYLLAVMGFSLIIAHFTKSQQTTMIIILLTFFMPGFLLSGLTDPVETGLTPSAIVSFLLPMTHYITLSRDIALKGLPIALLWKELAVLAGMGLLGSMVAVFLFRKKIA